MFIFIRVLGFRVLGGLGFLLGFCERFRGEIPLYLLDVCPALP